MITLELASTTLVIGEDTDLTVTVTNDSADPVAVPDLIRSPSWPRMILTNAGAGARLEFGPMDAADDDHGFIPPPDEVDRVLPPGASETMTATLLQRAPIPGAGSWRLEAAIEIAGRVVTSPAVAVDVAPLALRSVSVAGAHAGPSPVQHILWSQADGEGSILVQTTVGVDHEDRPFVVASKRLDRIARDARPVLSVSPSGEPFPGTWICWIESPAGPPGSGAPGLRALYALHARVEKTLPPRPLPARAHVLVGPSLHDFDREDASRPGSGEVVLWSERDGDGLAQVFTAGPDGTLRPGRLIDCDGGRPSWASAALLSDGERRIVLAVQDGGSVLLQVAAWKAGAAGRGRAYVLFDREGAAVASGASLNARDEWLGATLLRRPDARGERFALHLWTVGRAILAAAPETIAFDIPGDPDGSRAVVGRSPGGRALALITTGGRWFVVDGKSRPAPLAGDVAALGDPVAIAWPNERTALVVFASRERGLSVRGF